jgi:ribosomal protein S18 acetylase RimI-like enzyme
MSEPALRRATAADADKLTMLARAAYARHVAVIGREPMPMTADWAQLLSEQEIWIVDGLAGEAVASLALELQADHVMVWSVAVAPVHQQRGLGRHLMAFAETRARELQRPELRLFTNARMEGNIALYRRLGYSETRREDLADRVLVHMSKAVGVDGTIGT